MIIDFTVSWKLALAHTAVWKVLLFQIILIYHTVTRPWAGYFGIQISAGARDFSFSKTSRPALGLSQPPVQLVSGVLIVGVKQLGYEVDHSPPSSAEVKNEWSCTSVPPYAFMACRGNTLPVPLSVISVLSLYAIVFPKLENYVSSSTVS
jgi:hypothetical protein